MPQFEYSDHHLLLRVSAHHGSFAEITLYHGRDTGLKTTTASDRLGASAPNELASMSRALVATCNVVLHSSQ